jgi:hypothetical protein
VIALSSLTGALSGGADAMAQKETTSQVTPLGGVQGAVTGDPSSSPDTGLCRRRSAACLKMVSQRLNEIVPAIYVPMPARSPWRSSTA